MSVQSSPSTRSEHTLLAAFILPIAQALRLQGVDALALIESAGIDSASVINNDRRIPAVKLQRLLLACVEATGDEAFGLSAAECLQPQVLSGLGLAWLTSDTLYDGLRRTVRFGKLMSTGLSVQLQEEGEWVHMLLFQAEDIQEPQPAALDFAVAVVARMCQLTLGEFIAPATIDLARPRPTDPQRWEYMLASHVNFDAPQTRLTFVLSDIQQQLVTGDPELARVNDEQAEGYLASLMARNTSREVVEKIVERLPDGPPSQQQIATAMCVSNRTLQRKLKEEGTSFMDLLQDTRLNMARKYLRQPTRSVLETAYLLGFSEPSTFSRAFKRWTGVAPAEYRQQDQQTQ